MEGRRGIKGGEGGRWEGEGCRALPFSPNVQSGPIAAGHHQQALCYHHACSQDMIMASCLHVCTYFSSYILLSCGCGHGKLFC